MSSETSKEVSHETFFSCALLQSHLPLEEHYVTRVSNLAELDKQR